MPKDTKQRMVEAASLSLRERGLGATSFTDILALSGAARGAIYHHFPGGKDDLAEQAVAWTSERVRDTLEHLDGDTPGAVLRSFVEAVRPVVSEAAGGTSCAIAAVTVETSVDRIALHSAVRAAFASWVDALGARLREAGVASVRAHVVAHLMITFLEGSLIMARAAGEDAAFDHSADALLRALVDVDDSTSSL